MFSSELLVSLTHTHPHICVFVETFVHILLFPTPYPKYNHPN